MFKIRIQLGLLLGLFVVSNVYGQAAPGVLFILKQPVSILDFGLYRMAQDLDQWVQPQSFNLPKSSRTNYQLYYHKPSNKIRLQLDVRVPSSYLVEVSVKEDACTSVITSLRRYFHTASKGGRAMLNRERSLKGIYKYFSYNGANESERPEKAMLDIEQATVIRATLIPGPKIKEAFRCSAPLTGEAIQFFNTAGPFVD